MNRAKQIFLLIVLFLGAMAATFRVGIAVGAQNGVPGSVNDPLITKSYLDARLADVSGVGTPSGGMTKVNLTKGNKICGVEGTMFVLISGSATTSSDGIVNITGGEILKEGMTISKYNTYLSTDTAGAIRADSNAVVYVSGTYKLAR